MSTENKNPVQLTWYGRAGEWAKKNQADIVLVAGFVLVAIISFGIGYLTAPGPQKSPLLIEGPEAAIGEVLNQATGESATSSSQTRLMLANEKGMFVASKNGTKYHWPWCSFAKNIKPENEVWFRTEAEAQASGKYTACGCIKNQAPAGYVKK